MAASLTPRDAQADEIMRALEAADRAPAPDAMRGIDIIAALERDPNLTLDDVLGSSRPAPETLLGSGPAPRPRGEFLPVPLPDLPNSHAMPPGEGLQPQSRPEARELAQDASSFGQGANVAATVAAANPIGRAVSAIPRAVAAAPRATAALAGGVALAAGSADAQAPGRDTASSQAALDRMIAQRDELQAQRKKLTDERATFTDFSSPERIRAAQRTLNALGYEAGNADGRDGALWRAALAKYNADRKNEMDRISGELGGLGPQITAAQRQVQSDQRAAAQEAGGRRLREMEENVPWYQQAWRDYGPYAGAVLGGLVGYGGRVAVGSAVNERARKAAATADDLMAAGNRGGVSGRAARVNQFYTDGGGKPAPFTMTPGQRPYPFTANPNAPAADTLYPPSAVGRYAPGPALAGVGLLEATAGHFGAVKPAREELAAAQQAVGDDPSEANIRRLQTARDKLAGAEALAFFGRGVMGGVGAAEVKSQLKFSHVRPNVSVAEQERANIDLLLQKKQPRTATTATERRAAARAAEPASEPTWNSASQRWQLPNGAEWNPEMRRWRHPTGGFVGGAPPPQRD